jgi:hypothetical protein
MAQKLNKGDTVTLLPYKELFTVLTERNFFADSLKRPLAMGLGGTKGTVEKIEEKYQYDYFYYLPEGHTESYSIPYQAVDFSTNEKCTLLEWLKSSPLPEDLSPLPFNLTIDYMPSPVTRNKMDIMETQFDADITQTDVSFSAVITHEKDTLCTGIVKFTIKHPDFKGGVKRIVGVASFYAGQYKGSWSLAQIAESLATVKAFSKNWEQFGKGLNKEEDHMKSFTSILRPNNTKMDNTVKSLTKG